MTYINKIWGGVACIVNGALPPFLAIVYYSVGFTESVIEFCKHRTILSHIFCLMFLVEAMITVFQNYQFGKTMTCSLVILCLLHLYVIPKTLKRPALSHIM